MKQDLHSTVMPAAAWWDIHHNFANPEISGAHLSLKIKSVSERNA